MSTFIQAHFLVSYPAANLNRDDTGRPKTMNYGGADRLRVSSQSLKRAVRTSPVFISAVGGEELIGVRTQELMERMLRIIGNRLPRDAALEQIKGTLLKKTKGGEAKLLIGTQKKEKDKAGETDELIHLSTQELAAFDNLAEEIARGKKVEADQFKPLSDKPRACDLSMFGRMLAGAPEYNVEAAAQVAHAFTTHRAVVEDDYFTAVDELKAARKEADKGAGFVGVAEFGTGLFYLYTCINASLLVDNLRGDKDLFRKDGRRFYRGVGEDKPVRQAEQFREPRVRFLRPGRDRNAAAPQPRRRVPENRSVPRTTEITAVIHRRRPCSPKPNGGGDLFAASVGRLETMRDAFAKAYGAPAEHHEIMNVPGEKGTLEDLIRLAADAAHNAQPLRGNRHAA